ncbi:MAG: hypothetical protein ACXACR_10480, partial [Candidatus Hodarchaeales archaeon]
MQPRLIEHTFPIREISELAIPERSSYKPIYQISKWFARRSSSTFRAILLGSILPSTADLMSHFYKDHNFSGITVFDPFMGGGTTILEGLRLGLNCIGNDLNPIAWFITKTEAELIDIEELKLSIHDCEHDVGDSIKKWYKTLCPVCEHQAEIIYSHWVKLLPCNKCKSLIPLFRNFLVAVKGKKSTIICPSCESVFEHIGLLPPEVQCSQCQFEFNPSKGYRFGRNSCKCQHCGTSNNILEEQKKSVDVLPSKLFALEGFCFHCASDKSSESPLKATNFKFIKRVVQTDLDLYHQAELEWNKKAEEFLWPKEEIPSGIATRTLHNHNYRKWADLFNARQLLTLSMIIEYIQKIPNHTLQEMFLAAFI